MAQVSVLGLGAMGSTLARVLLLCGHDVTAWNRSDSERARIVMWAPGMSARASRYDRSPASSSASSVIR